MDDSTSNSQVNQSEVDFKTESNEVPETFYVIDDQFVPKVGMTFKTLDDATKFYKDYSKVVLHHSHPCCPDQAQMLKQHRELSIKDSFDRNWNDFLLKYGLVDNKWLSAQFQHVYTHQKFRKVQAQFRGKANCITRLTNSALGYSVYKVGEQVSSSIFNKFVVTYDSVAAQVKCQCLLFESRGILCRHALSMLSFERVTQVSPRYIYILERWSKKVKRRHTHIKSSHDEPLLEPRSKRFDELVFHSQNIYEFASELKDLTAILYRAYDNVMVEME
ncbi:hypothetical protein Ahy_B03g067202 [Arachis hypogaea]|uniref:Protein FAR1-RELATED SEQUENCE n=1 Tax=Arachis hypogaea TaxID=3818 RepID=A0A445A672_ARAHY|nr:hypothetical protein Ahy_B03g067202 [Arachis hypogaea]